MELMRQLALGKSRALIVVTHDARIFEFADRIAPPVSKAPQPPYQAFVAGAGKCKL